MKPTLHVEGTAQAARAVWVQPAVATMPHDWQLPGAGPLESSSPWGSRAGQDRPCSRRPCMWWAAHNWGSSLTHLVSTHMEEEGGGEGGGGGHPAGPGAEPVTGVLPDSHSGARAQAAKASRVQPTAV